MQNMKNIAQSQPTIAISLAGLITKCFIDDVLFLAALDVIRLSIAGTINAINTIEIYFMFTPLPALEELPLR